MKDSLFYVCDTCYQTHIKLHKSQKEHGYMKDNLFYVCDTCFQTHIKLHKRQKEYGYMKDNLFYVYVTCVTRPTSSYIKDRKNMIT